MGELFRVFLVKTSVVDLVVRMGPAGSRVLGGVTPCSGGGVRPLAGAACTLERGRRAPFSGGGVRLVA